MSNNFYGQEIEPTEWDIWHDRAYPLIEEILTKRPRTMIGLSVIARAMVLDNTELWTSAPHMEDGRHRSAIEAICNFVGMTPLPLLVAVS
jgi:hypothetical protein